MKRTITSFAAVFIMVAAGGVRAADYYPLAIGDRWDYAFTAIMIDSTYTIPLTMAVAGDTMIGQDSVFTMKLWSEPDTLKDTSEGYYRVQGNSILTLDSLNPPMPYNKVSEHHPKEGEGWKNDNGDTMTMVYYGSITVPAGTFDSCYAVKDKNNDTVFVFAPDVGMVRIVHPGNSRFELTAYSVYLPAPVERPLPGVLRAPQKPGIRPGRYSLLDARGRFIDIVTVNKNGEMDRGLARGTYFLVEKDPCLSRIKRAVKLCVTGK